MGYWPVALTRALMLPLPYCWNTTHISRCPTDRYYRVHFCALRDKLCQNSFMITMERNRMQGIDHLTLISLLGDQAFEWQRGCRWPSFDTDLSAFVVKMHLGSIRNTLFTQQKLWGQNKVNSSLATIQMPGHRAENCKMVYLWHCFAGSRVFRQQYGKNQTLKSYPFHTFHIDLIHIKGKNSILRIHWTKW